MSEYQIEADFRAALRKADQLDEIAGNVNGEIQDLEQIQNALSQAWQSDHSREYIQKLNIVKENLEKRVRDIRRTAQVIRESARELRDSEMRALEIARQRTYRHK